jgi:hypothetical protein
LLTSDIDVDVTVPVFPEVSGTLTGYLLEAEGELVQPVQVTADFVGYLLTSNFLANGLPPPDLHVSPPEFGAGNGFRIGSGAYFNYGSGPFKL